MKSKPLIILAVLFLCAWPAFAVIEFNDGLTHDIDYHIYDDVWVDYQTPGMYTTVNCLNGSFIHHLFGYEHSMINKCGGDIVSLAGFDSSQINISGGWMLLLSCFDSSQIDISGGSDGISLDVCNKGVVRIFGYDFTVDSQPVGYGELTSIYGGGAVKEPIRSLIGTLVSGERIRCAFRIGEDAKIILIPEPASILLLGLGVIAIRKR